MGVLDAGTVKDACRSFLSFLPLILTFTGGALVFGLIEDMTAEEAFYFASISMTTIGFGDVTPVSSWGKLLVVFYAYLSFVMLGWSLRVSDGAVRKILIMEVLDLHGRAANAGRAVFGNWYDKLDPTTWRTMGMGVCTIVLGMFQVFMVGLTEELKLPEAVIFSAATVTTIGYGDVTPTKTIGRILTMVFAWLGLIVLSFTLQSSQLMVVTRFRRILPTRRARYMKKYIGASVGAVVAVWIIGGVMFSLVEKWSLLDGFYFGAVTLSTVGYGDLVPVTHLGRLVMIVFITVGMAAVGHAISGIGAVAEMRLSEARDMAVRLEATYLDRIEAGYGAVESTGAALSTHTLAASKRKRPPKHDLAIMCGIQVLLFSSMTLLVCLVEKWAIVDGMYFSAETLTTIGYGDRTPLSTAGKYLSMFYCWAAVVWVSYMLTVIQAITTNRVLERMVVEQQENLKDGAPLMELSETGDGTEVYPVAEFMRKKKKKKTPRL